MVSIDFKDIQRTREALGMYVRIPHQTRTRVTTLTLKIIHRHADITVSDGTVCASFLARRARFNTDGTVDTYGADHAYLVKLCDLTVIRE